MNQNINTTLAALIPVLRMNGENVVSIEAVHDWYKGQYKDANGRPREYMKEVAEITYESGGVKYADIGGDSNLTACYDVIAVIQQTKPQSAVIERIERGVYPAAQPEKRTEKRTETHACDCISRQAAIDALEREKSLVERPITETRWFDFGLRKAQDVLSELPSAQPEIIHCKECKYGVQDEDKRWYCRGLGCQVGEADGSGFCADAERRE